MGGFWGPDDQGGLAGVDHGLGKPLAASHSTRVVVIEKTPGLAACYSLSDSWWLLFLHKGSPLILQGLL